MSQLISGRIDVGTARGVVQIRVTGRASHLISQPLREFAAKMIREGFREFAVELSECLYLDSTFAGVLAGFSLKLKELGGAVTLLQVPPGCAEMLATLGIENLFLWGPDKLLPSDPEGTYQLPTAAPSTEAWAGTIVEAHRVLSQADEANAVGYQDVIEYLKAAAASPRGRFRN